MECKQCCLVKPEYESEFQKLLIQEIAKVMSEGKRVFINGKEIKL